MMRGPDKPDTMDDLKQQVLQMSEDAILILDSEHAVIWANEPMLKLLGQELDVLAGRDFADVSQKMPLSLILDSLVEATLQTDSSLTEEIVIEAETILTVSISPLPGNDGTRRASVVRLHSHLAQDASPFSIGKVVSWHSVLDAIAHSTLILDSEQRILYANLITHSLLGIDPESDIIGKHCYEIFHSTSAPPDGCPFVKLVSEDSIQVSKGQMKLRDHDVMVSVSAIPSDGNESGRFVHIATDITPRLLAEDAAKLYLDVLSHDVANHLQTVLLGVSILAKGENSDIAKIVFTSIGQINRLIMKARAVEGLETSEMHDYVIQEALTDLVEQVRAQHQTIEIVLDIPDAACMTRANRYLVTAIENLLDNAIRYNPRETKQIWISLSSAPKMWELRIADNGAGLLDARKSILLDRSRRFGGMGIHQTNLIVRWFGGTLSVQDRVPDHPEMGAEFVIHLPQAA